MNLKNIEVQIDFALRNSDTWEEFRERCVDAFLFYGEQELGIDQGASAEEFMANDYDIDLKIIWNSKGDNNERI